MVSGTSIGATVESIGDNDPLVFDNSESVFMLGEEVTVGSGASAVTKTVVKSYITWYNMDTGEYEII
jgi:pyruvate/2-oxoglutarate/acetoin dehydrogenase E1 component